MNSILLAARDFPELDSLRESLAPSLELLYSGHIPTARAMLADQRISVLVLDCSGDARAEYELLQFVEQQRPEVECIALVDPEHFCSVYQTRQRNLFRLLKPTTLEELQERILRTVHKAERAFSGAWAADPVLMRRQDQQFW